MRTVIPFFAVAFGATSIVRAEPQAADAAICSDPAATDPTDETCGNAEAAASAGTAIRTPASIRAASAGTATEAPTQAAASIAASVAAPVWATTGGLGARFVEATTGGLGARFVDETGAPGLARFETRVSAPPPGPPPARYPRAVIDRPT